MKITELKVINFRNYSENIFRFNDKINIIIADNASGKTNILEAVNVLSTTKSFRFSSEKKITKYNEKGYYLLGKIISGNEPHKFETSYYDNNKYLKIDGDKISSAADYIGKFNTAVYYPDEVILVKGGPVYRRRFINLNLIKRSKDNYIYLRDYLKIVKQKNKALKLLSENRCDYKVIDTLNRQLIKFASEIVYRRYSFIEDLKKIVRRIYDLLNKGKIEIEYKTNCLKLENGTGKDDIRKFVKTKIEQTAYKEKRNRRSLVGPHLDDMIIKIDGKEARYFCSQGQQKIITLSLKLSEAEYFKQFTGEYPVLLLDDIFSELDKRHVNSLLKYLDKELQCFITDVNYSNIFDEIKNKKIYTISNGELVTY